MTSDNLTTQPLVDAEFDLSTQEGEEEIIDRPWLRPGKWYVVHSQSSYEKKALQAMQAHQDAARKAYIAILDIMEPPKPKVAEGQIPPDDPVVATYRRRLSSVVLS